MYITHYKLWLWRKQYQIWVLAKHLDHNSFLQRKCERIKNMYFYITATNTIYDMILLKLDVGWSYFGLVTITCEYTCIYFFCLSLYSWIRTKLYCSEQSNYSQGSILGFLMTPLKIRIGNIILSITALPFVMNFDLIWSYWQTKCKQRLYEVHTAIFWIV